MTWFTRFTRFGDVHMVYSQENSNSCGIACVRMVVFKVNKLRLGATARHSEATLDAAYGKVAGAPYDGSTYSDARQLATLLGQLTSDTWSCDYVGAEGVADALLAGVGPSPIAPTVVGQAMALKCSPMILLVGFYNGANHFVVVDTIHQFNGQAYASVCDPWDGDVHVTPFAKGQAFIYNAVAHPLSWSFGKPEHSYATSPRSGATNGWVIRKS